MYRSVGMIMVAFALVVPRMAQADANVKFARSKQCLACHQVDSQRVGPSFRAIADRYAGAPAAQQYLANTIRDGSRGKWGAIPMPAQAQVNAVDAARLAAWVLSLADSAATE